MLLSGIRVVDFGRFIAGPYCAALLGDYGADVIRVERIAGGEDRYVAPVADSGEGAPFFQMNRNKRCLTLHLGSPRAGEVVQRLVRDADVIVANLPPATLTRWGLEYEALAAINPRIVLTLATAYGRGGPYSERVGFDTIGQAMSAAMHLSGEPDRPVRTIVNYNDFATATACAMGTLAALWERERSGVGQLVEGSLLRTSLIHMNALLAEQALTGRDRSPQGNRSFNAAPVDSFRTRSGWITVQVVGNAVFRRWCELVYQPQLHEDPRYASDAARAEHGEDLSDVMSRWCAQHSRDEALRLLADARIPAAPIYSAPEVLRDPHVRELGLLPDAQYPTIQQPFPLTGHPVEMSVSRPQPQRRAPMLGEHTDEILAELGYGPQEIRHLREAGVV